MNVYRPGECRRKRLSEDDHDPFEASRGAARGRDFVGDGAERSPANGWPRLSLRVRLRVPAPPAFMCLLSALPSALALLGRVLVNSRYVVIGQPIAESKVEAAWRAQFKRSGATQPGLRYRWPSR
jgi:hypothetical protein